MLDEKTKPARGIYLIPNLITTIGLFGGFLSIIHALRGDFKMAALYVYIAMIADLLDGRVARLTNTQSEFGAQYDSLSDMVSFGIAPALVIYTWSLSSLHFFDVKVGGLIAFCYVAAGALRLARFNTQDDHSGGFQGLSIPAAAGLMVGLVWVLHPRQEHHYILNVPLVSSHEYLGAIIAIMTALLMVSTIPYYSFKNFDSRRKVHFIAILVVVLALIIVSINPPMVIFAGFVLYALSGPLLLLARLLRRQGKKGVGE